MKNYFLFLASILNFSPLLQASSPNPVFLRQAIAGGHTQWALELIKDGGAAGPLGPDRLQVIHATGPHCDTRLELPPLALATYCNQIPVVEALLAEGHSTYEPVSLRIQVHGNQNFSDVSLTTLDLAIRCKKQAASTIKSHLAMLAVLEIDSFPTEDQTVATSRPAAQMTEPQKEFDDYDGKDRMRT